MSPFVLEAKQAEIDRLERDKALRMAGDAALALKAELRRRSGDAE